MKHNHLNKLLVGSIWNLVEVGQLISEEKVFNNIMILYMYTA